jgi:hypothetical protein
MSAETLSGFFSYNPLCWRVGPGHDALAHAGLRERHANGLCPAPRGNLHQIPIEPESHRNAGELEVATGKNEVGWCRKSAMRRPAQICGGRNTNRTQEPQTSPIFQAPARGFDYHATAAILIIIIVTASVLDIASQRLPKLFL